MTKSSVANPVLFSLISILLLSSCGSSEKTDDTQQGAVQLTAEAKGDSGHTELFSMPAPMQVASAIKRTNSNYVDGLLAPSNARNSSAFSKTLNLGMYAVDLGYANVYDQHQTSIIYFSNSLKLSDDLKIMGPFEPSTINRFKENVTNSDSTAHYTLSSFRKIHENLINSKRDEEAYLILAGSFIEGLYLTSEIQKKNKNEQLVHLIGEQKLFLESVTKILSTSESKEIVDLLVQLNDLKTIYGRIDVNYKTTNAESKEILPIVVSNDLLKEINEKITIIRNGVFQPSV